MASSSVGIIKCRNCEATLYYFDQLAILDSENQLIVRPEVPAAFFAGRNLTGRRRRLCSSCEKKVGSCQADAICETAYDGIRGKSVRIHFPDGWEVEEDKLQGLFERFEKSGVPRIKHKEFVERAGGRFWSRDGRPIHSTVIVDTESTELETLQRLTITPMRNYQMEMLRFCLKQNSLLCLPTGSGKTLVAAGVLRAMLHLNPRKVAVFVVNTNPLVQQQSHVLETEIPSARVVTLFGQMDPFLRSTHLKVLGRFQYDILVATCQCLNRLLEIGTVRVVDMCCLVLDEVHETRGNSPYYHLVCKVQHPDIKKVHRPLILGMTASPLDSIDEGEVDKTIEMKIWNLAGRIECFPCFPQENDPYENGISHTKDIAFKVESSSGEKELQLKLDTYLLSVVQAVKDPLKEVAPTLQHLQELFDTQKDTFDTNKVRGRLRKIEDNLNAAVAEKQKENVECLVFWGYAIRDHMNQILAIHEINNIIGHEVAKQQLKKVFDGIEDPPPGQETRKKEILYNFRKDFQGDAIYASLHEELKKTCTADVYSPHLLSGKCKEMISMIETHYAEHRDGTRILVFVDMRRTAKKLCACFARVSVIRTTLNPQVIVGRGLCGDGLSIEEQQEILNDFRRGQTKLLVTTTILEEGLDVPSCNLVLRMKAPENLRQFIQSRGRACRSTNGKFFIICKDMEEVKVQQAFLTCMENQAKVIKTMMSAEHSVSRLNEHPRALLNLEMESGRKEHKIEEQAQHTEEIGEEEMQEMINLMKQVDENPEQTELRFLDEDDQREVEIKVKFAIFTREEEKYKSDVQELKRGLDILCPEVHILEWQDTELNIENNLDTYYFPEATLTQTEPTDTEDVHLFETTVVRALTSNALNTTDVCFWSSVVNPRNYFPKSTSLRLSLHQTYIGSLKTQDTFVQHMPLGKASNLRMERGGDKITVTVNDIFQVEASFADLQDFALVNFKEGDSVEDGLLILYLTFSQPPRFANIQHATEDSKMETCRAIEYGDTSTRHVFAHCLTYKLEIPNPRSTSHRSLMDHRIREVLRLLESSGVTVYFAAVTTVAPSWPLPEDDEGLDPGLNPVHYKSKEVNYAMRCLMSSSAFVAERLTEEFYGILNGLSESDALLAIYGLIKIMNKNHFCDPVWRLNHIVKDGTHARPPSINSKDHAYIKRVAITPTSFRFYEPDFVQTNRIVRQNKAEAFIRVAIRDEDHSNLTSIHGTLPKIIDRIRDVMNCGLKIGQTRYVYLAASNSQIRGHSCYFIEDDGCGIADSIRDRIGDLHDITNVASYASRMGLGFSTSSRTVTIGYYYIESDFETEKFTFSDGVGLIEESLAKQVQDKMKLALTPSAFQIRLGGCKGVVTVWPESFFKENNYPANLVVRNSMLKYESDNKTIEVLEWTRPLPLHLNQQVIMLLTNLGVGDDVIMDMLRSEILTMGKMFVEEEAAVENLRFAAAEETRPLQQVRFPFTSDPFFRSIMVACYRLRMKDLREKSRVLLDKDKGRVLIGVLDETGILQYGEVFIQISENIEQPGIQKRIITSAIVIMKNPCLHPGDARTFQGRNVPQLRHLVDCVVFPRNGPRPHPNELSGSDLDGDQYHCIWDPRLLPPMPMKEAMDYTGAQKIELSEPIRVRHIVDYTCDYVENDTLGMIDNTHKALADQQGIESDTCLQLAQIHALAVDAQKTGKWQTVPKDIKYQLTKYPDFMMKMDKASYASEQLLGKMFRECNKYMTDTALPETMRMTGPRPNSAFKVDGYEAYVEDAYKWFKQYNSQLLSIMHMYGIETEAEIWSGSIETVHPRLRDEIDDVQKNVKKLLGEIVDAYRKLFHNDPKLDSGDRKEQERKKASAWYLVTYSKRYGDSYSIDIYQENTSKADVPVRSLHSEISDSVKEIFDGTINKLIGSYISHQNLCNSIGGECHRFASCTLFGTSGLMLYNEPAGEAQILIVKKRNFHPNPSKTDQINLLEKVKSDVRYFFNVVHLNEEQRQLRVVVNRKLPLRRASLTADIREVIKWVVLKKYISKNRWLFPTLKILCTWTTTTGLVDGRVHFLPVYLVPLMFIDHCLKGDEFSAVPAAQCLNAAGDFCENCTRPDLFGTDQEWDNLCQFLANPDPPHAWEGPNPGRVGRLLCAFMKKGRSFANSPLHPSLAQVLEMKEWKEAEKPERLDLLFAEMEKASHRLSLHVDASVLLTKVTVERIFFIELAAARSLAGDENGLTRMLHQKSGAWVDVQARLSSKNPGMIVKGKGTEAELFLLQKRIDHLNITAEAQQKSRRVVRVRGMKDVSGAHNLMIEGAAAESELIRLEPYLGFRYPQHDFKHLYVIRLHGHAPAPPADPTNTEAFDQFRKHFKHQISYFQRHHSEEVYGPPELQVKFGRSYVVSPPTSFVEDSTHLTTAELVKALERRKARVVDPMFDTGFSRQRSVHAHTNESFVSTSFVSSVMMGREEREYLKQQVLEQAAQTKAEECVPKETGVKVIAQTGTGVMTARYDAHLKFSGIETSPIRWIVSDLKRTCVLDNDGVEGCECDIRFMLKTQMSECVDVTDHAQKMDFENAIGRDEKGKVYMKNPKLDVDYMEDYNTFTYRMHDLRFGIGCQMIVRTATQYTRRVAHGRFSSQRDIVEVRIVPNVEPFLDHSTMENALDALWAEAYVFSQNLKCKTQ